MIKWEYLPWYLERHRDKVLYLDENWLILDGITKSGSELDAGLISVLYRHQRRDHKSTQIMTIASKELWNDTMFWKVVRHQVVNKLCEIRKEINKPMR